MDERWRVSGRRRWEIARVSIDSQNIGRRLFAGNLEWLTMDGKNLTMEMSRTMGGASDEPINTAHPCLHLFARNIKPPGLRGIYGGFYPAVLGSTISWGGGIGRTYGTLSKSDEQKWFRIAMTADGGGGDSDDDDGGRCGYVCIYFLFSVQMATIMKVARPTTMVKMVMPMVADGRAGEGHDA
ncbi:hypothetical protein L2E82_06542 [Cichorium intybus]|uniref:Uncharacterized protein n=1 Tax=Cichorium intybus TaxID=13427 RepID=A0ACB9HBJ3_CICIN|nr:hypothetical protein L2E82_06542 [Cichorium intybus]